MRREWQFLPMVCSANAVKHRKQCLFLFPCSLKLFSLLLRNDSPEDKPVSLASKSHFGVGFVLNPRRFVRNAWFYLSVSLSDLYTTYCDCFWAVGGGKLWESVSCCCCNFSSLRYDSKHDSVVYLYNSGSLVCTVIDDFRAFLFSSLSLCCTSTVGFYCRPAMHDQSHYTKTSRVRLLEKLDFSLKRLNGMLFMWNLVLIKKNKNNLVYVTATPILLFAFYWLYVFNRHSFCSAKARWSAFQRRLCNFCVVTVDVT